MRPALTFADFPDFDLSPAKWRRAMLQRIADRLNALTAATEAHRSAVETEGLSTMH